MHEQSLVKMLLQQVETIRLKNSAGSVKEAPTEEIRVEEIRVEVGPLSGVEPTLLHSAYERLTEAEPSRARLVIDEVPLTAQCKECDQEFEVQEFVFQCPRCQGNVRVTRGDQMQLASVSLVIGHAEGREVLSS